MYSLDRIAGPLTLATLLLGPQAAAQAGEPETVEVLVLPVATEGEVSQVARQRIERALEEALDASGLRVTIASEGTCADAACVVDRARAEGGYVLQLHVAGEARDYQLVLEASDATGQVSRSEAECAICGFDEVAAVVGDEATAMGGKLTATRAPGIVNVTSDPPGATVIVDGETAGVTPMALTLSPGSHEIRLEKSGRIDAHTEVVAASGVEDSIQLALAEVPVEDRPRMRKAGWASLGTGIGLSVGAGVLLALHHQPVKGRCDDPSAIDTEGLCRWRYNSVPLGTAVLAVGVAGVVTGAVLVGLSKKQGRGGKHALVPQIGPTGLGLSGRF